MDLIAGRHSSVGTYCLYLQNGSDSPASSFGRNVLPVSSESRIFILRKSEVTGSGEALMPVHEITRCRTYHALAGILDLPWESFNPTQLISQGKYSRGKQLWSDDGVVLTIEGHAEVRLGL